MTTDYDRWLDDAVSYEAEPLRVTQADEDSGYVTVDERVDVYYSLNPETRKHELHPEYGFWVHPYKGSPDVEACIEAALEYLDKELD